MPVGPTLFKFTCTNTALSECATCSKTFAIPDSAIQGVFKDADLKATILIKRVHYLPMPMCGNPAHGANLLFIKTATNYAALLNNVLSQAWNVVDGGNVALVPLDYVSRG